MFALLCGYSRQHGANKKRSMKDNLLQLHEFINAVVAALNTAGVAPSDDAVCAVMLVVAPDDRTVPLSCSLNYDRQARQWSSYDPEMAERA